MTTDNNEISTSGISSFRRYLPQILACSAKNVLLVIGGLAAGLPTIIISALSGLNPANNPNEHLKISSNEASWIASIFALSIVLGSCMSGFLDVIGRKKAIIFCNIPLLFGSLYLYYFSTSIFDIYMILGLFGITLGCAESAIFNYIGEMAEVKIRGILAITGSISVELGSAIVFALANQMPWRDTSLVFAAFPIAGIISMLLVPETPQWLLSQNRNDEALRALQWLRGWIHPDDVKIEFQNLQRYKARTHACMECERQNIENVICDHRPREKFIERLREFFRRKNLIPLGLVICACSNSLFCGTVFSPYFVPILKFYKSPIDPNTVLVWTGFIGTITIVLTMVLIRLFGKRIIHLISLALIVVTMYALGLHGFYYVDRPSDDNNLIQQYFPVYGLLFIKFLFNLGLRVLPNLLLSEVFSYRSKSIGSGISVAIWSTASFVSAKTFFLLQEAITLPGQWMLYASIGAVGFVVAYLLLPETEGKSLEDIEMYFSDKKRKLFDINIPELTEQDKISKH